MADYTKEEREILQKAEEIRLRQRRERSSPLTVFVPGYGQIFVTKLRDEHNKALDRKEKSKKEDE